MEFEGAPFDPTFSQTIDGLEAGRYLVLLEANIAGGAADCYASIEPVNATFASLTFLGRYWNEDVDSTRSFRMMRLDAQGSITVECSAASGAPGLGSPVSADGMFAVVPLS
jgi:hypothetical protein